MAAERRADASIRALGVVGTTSEQSRTRSLVEAVLSGVVATTATETEVLVLGAYELAVADGTRAEDQVGDTRVILDALERSDVVVLGTPVYRAAYSGLTKELLDLVPRGTYDGNTRPLQGKPVVLVATAATPAHFLALDQLTTILHGFFAAHVIPPGVFAANADFTEQRELVPAVFERAVEAGRALAEMHDALARSPALGAVSPQV